MLDRLRSTIMAGVDAWHSFDGLTDHERRQRHYADLWALYEGTAFNTAWRRQGPFRDARVYRNTRLLWKHIESVGDFYAATVYQGALPTDGKRLPDGSRGAIPIDPQVTGEAGAPDDAANEQLLAAVSEQWNRWNWQQGMSMRPLYCSILGDGLTELIDAPSKHNVWPSFVWPGYVPEIQLDSTTIRNVVSYALEYPITRIVRGREETGIFRKEVNKEAYRYYFKDEPWDDPDGHGEWEQENPYGFVPAIWDVHKIGSGVRGISAIAGTLQAVYELNSLLSHGFDYQRKAFSQPVLIKGGGMTNSLLDAVRQVIGPNRTIDAEALAESMPYREVGQNVGFEMVKTDIGSTLEIVNWIKEGILEENPEAQFWKEIRQLSQATGPGIDRMMGDAVNRTQRSRNGYDPQTVKLHQMSIAIAGHRLNNGDWENPTARDRVFEPFDLTSYKAGKLDMTILPRPVVPETEDERIARLKATEELEEQESFVALGIDETDATQRIARREAAALRRSNLLTGF